MNFLENNYYKVLFMKNDIKELTGFGYIYSYYSKNKNTFTSQFSKFEPTFNVKYKILIIFFFLPLLYTVKNICLFFQKYNKNRFKNKNLLIVGSPASFTFFIYLLGNNVDTYTVDTLYSYYKNKNINIFSKSIILFMTKLIDKYVCHASNSNYFLNSFSVRNFQNISQNSQKYKSLPIGMDMTRIKQIGSSFSNKGKKLKVIGIYSNFYYYEHQYFINKFINLINKNYINNISQKYLINISGIYSKEIVKKYLIKKPYFSKLLESNGSFDSLVSWLADVDSLIIPFLSTCGIKIKLFEAIASCKPVMVNQSILDHLPEGFDELFPSLFIYQELSIKSLNQFLYFSKSYYSSKKYLNTKSNLNLLTWENMRKFGKKKK